MRIAAIDVGTNTVLLVVADVAAGRLDVLTDQERFARLGQGVDANGFLADEAMARVVDRLRTCRDVARELGAERVIVGATSASRDAGNTHVLVDRVRSELGLDYTVVSGETEAALSFRGALAMLGERAPAGPALVIDVGGGSTEFVAGTTGAPPTHRTSLNVGSVRLTERHFREMPAPSTAVAAARREVGDAFARLPDGLRGVGTAVAVAGTARVAATLAGRVQPGQRPGAIRLDVVEEWRDRLLSLSVEQTLALDPPLMTDRADVAAAGLLILAAALGAVAQDRFVYSPGGLRHGLALAAAESSL